MTRLSPEVVRIRWAHFVDRSLTAARTRGMTDRDIEQRTKIRASTFHRWRRGEVRTMPTLSKVVAFCEGVGASLDEAMRALDMSPETPGPQRAADSAVMLDPDLREIMRMLMDPNTSEVDRIFLRESLKMLAERSKRRGYPDEGAASA